MMNDGQSHFIVDIKIYLKNYSDSYSASCVFCLCFRISCLCLLANQKSVDQLVLCQRQLSKVANDW